MIERIHHVGIAVRDADASLAFYRDILGLPVTKDVVLEDQGIRGLLLDAGGAEIELLQPLHANTPVGRFLERRGEGLHHLCFATEDIDAELDLARLRGLPLIDQKARLGLAGRIAFIHPNATHGVLVEYAQPLAPEADTQGARDGSGGVHVTGFDHLAVVVAEVEPAARAYLENFGLQAAPPVDRIALGIRIASVSVGAAFIGIIAPLQPTGGHARFLARRGEGLYLISLAVEQLDLARERLSARSVQIGEAVVADAGARFALVSPHSASGVLLQLVERAS